MPKAFSEHEREAVKKEMISIGSKLIRKKGLRQTTIEDITKGVGVAKGSFYSFYSSREEFFWEIIKLEEKQLIKNIKNVAQEDIATRDKMRKIFNDVFLQENCLAFYLPQADIQYITRKLPPELLQTDMENGQDVIKMLLAMCGFNQNNENVELVMSMIHTLQFVASDVQIQDSSTKNAMLGILVEAFAEHLDRENM